MTIPTIAFFNNKGGVGKTSLVYHTAWMYADLKHRVLAVDLDPQANLTAAMVSEDRLEELWDGGKGEHTLFGAIQPLMRGIGDVRAPHREPLHERLELVVGDLSISGFEDELASQWSRCLDSQERAFRVISAFHRCIQLAAAESSAEVVVIDLGPNLGAINRAALVASRYVVVPVAPDLFSLQGLRNLGPTVRRWRREWEERLRKNPSPELGLPDNPMNPSGYIVLQHSVRLDRPMQAYDRWMTRIPEIYSREVLAEVPVADHPERDAHCLGLLKRYGSLMPMAQEARKPIFHLKPADGALGTHAKAARDARNDFEVVARAIEEHTWRPRRPRKPASGSRS
jgi:chromosome partitioning protein